MITIKDTLDWDWIQWGSSGVGSEQDGARKNSTDRPEGACMGERAIKYSVSSSRWLEKARTIPNTHA